MAVCADMERVFEIGPVFRAEDSLTHRYCNTTSYCWLYARHLCEFTGLDIEMAFYEHYHEVLDVLDGLFHHIFTGLETKFAKEIQIISQQYAIEVNLSNVLFLRCFTAIASHLP